MPDNVLADAVTHLGDSAGGKEGVPPASLWTQREAAAYLHVTPRYLRDSSCPKILLPGNGPHGRPIVRYEPRAVRHWIAQRSVGHAVPEGR